jgi:hypothetical protein
MICATHIRYEWSRPSSSDLLPYLLGHSRCLALLFRSICIPTASTSGLWRRAVLVAISNCEQASHIAASCSGLRRRIEQFKWAVRCTPATLAVVRATLCPREESISTEGRQRSTAQPTRARVQSSQRGESKTLSAQIRVYSGHSIV